MRLLLTLKQLKKNWQMPCKKGEGLMDTSAKNELAAIKKELNSIISELESISNGVRKSFSGIGNDRCADCIDKVVDQYCYVKKKLNNMDTSTVTEEFQRAHGGGGGGGSF